MVVFTCGPFIDHIADSIRMYPVHLESHCTESLFVRVISILSSYLIIPAADILQHWVQALLPKHLDISRLHFYLKAEKPVLWLSLKVVSLQSFIEVFLRLSRFLRCSFVLPDRSVSTNDVVANPSYGSVLL